MANVGLDYQALKIVTPSKHSIYTPSGLAHHVPKKLKSGVRIGLLGGSFNPAHAGHLEISALALNLLKLDTIWWLVTPQNPLKTEENMAPLVQRFRSARFVAGSLPIEVTDIEAELGNTYTAETLSALKNRYPEASFVWLMGADNLCEVHRWKDWTKIFQTVPIAVFARPTYSLRAEKSWAARRFAKYRVKTYRARTLAIRRPPAWVIFKRPLNPESATNIRAKGKNLVVNSKHI